MSPLSRIKVREPSGCCCTRNREFPFPAQPDSFRSTRLGTCDYSGAGFSACTESPKSKLVRWPKPSAWLRISITTPGE